MKSSSSQEESVAESSQMGTAEELCLKADRAFNGHGESQDYEKARQLYLEASQLSSARACACLAKMYETGMGVERNLAEAFNFYRQGASLGDTTCMFALGKYYEKNIVPENEPNRGMEDAVSYYERAAGEGNAEALTKLGYMYEQGIYYKSDIGKAVEYYTRAVQKSDPLAMNYLGLHYYRQGTASVFTAEEQNVAAEGSSQRNLRKAAELFKRAHELGCARAANNLGVCYEQGAGVERDIEQAFTCYKDAADRKYAQGMFNLGYLYLQKAKTTKLMEHFERAAHWLRCAINEDPQLSDASFYLGFLFEKGLGVDCDFQTAFNYYHSAAGLGHAKASKRCGDLLYSGNEMLAPNKAEAIKYYSRAAELGDPEAYNALGLMYEQGEEVGRNEETAFHSYIKAQELGSADADVNLSMMYERGIFVGRDPEKARDLMISAAGKGNQPAKEYLLANGILTPLHPTERKDVSAILPESSSAGFFMKKTFTMSDNRFYPEAAALEADRKSRAPTFGRTFPVRNGVFGFDSTISSNRAGAEKRSPSPSPKPKAVPESVTAEKQASVSSPGKQPSEVAELHLPDVPKDSLHLGAREGSEDKDKLEFVEGASAMDIKKVEDNVTVQPELA